MKWIVDPCSNRHDDKYPNEFIELNQMEDTILISIIFLVALIYSSVGFGGGSSYIAVFLLFEIPVESIRFMALALNIVVVSGSVINYHRAKMIPWNKVLPLVILSAPLAFIGGTISPGQEFYQVMAASFLIIASFIMLLPKKKDRNGVELSRPQLAGIGGGIGFLSGLVGIGGGIFLSPILHISKWETIQIIGGACSFFILVNSFFGILGQTINTEIISISFILPLLLAAFIGGQIGNRLNIKFLKPSTIRPMTALLIGVVGVRILYKCLF